jgi:capsular exopolysaccharide synthesis family protein
MDIRRASRSDESDNHSSFLQPQHYNVSLLRSPAAEEGQEEGGLAIGQIFDSIRRRIGLILGAAVVVAGLSAAWGRTRPPSYEGAFKILIEPVTVESQVVSELKGEGGGTQNQAVGDAQTSSETTLDYPTQIQLLLSPKLLMPVVQKLKPSYPELTYDTLKGALTISRFKDPDETKILDIRFKSTSESEAKQVTQLISRSYIDYSLRERQTNVRRAIEFLDTQKPKVEAQVRELEAALQNFREKNQLLDPATLGTQLSTQVGTIQQQQLETQTELNKTKQLYRSLEQQLQLQPRSAEAASVLSEAPDYQQLVRELQETDVELQTQSAELSADHPKVIALREKRERLLPLIQQKANAAVGANVSRSVSNPQSLPYQNALRQALSRQYVDAAVQIQVLEAQLKGLNRSRLALARQSSQLPAISRQYDNLQRRLEIATEQLSKFIETREQLMVNAARQEVPWELIAAPTVQQISSTSLLRDLVLGSILGLLLGTGVALLLEKMHDVIYSIKDLREETKIPVLGIIPKQADINKLQYSTQFLSANDATFILGADESETVNQKIRYRFSPFSEAFRALNSQIRLLRPDVQIKSLVISSSLPAEGKTTVAMQLAQAAAAMGQRVLLVDADLRKPGLQDLVGANHSSGLTDVILGNPLMETVQLLQGEDKLYVLPAGSIALDPTSLLSSNKMKELVRNCQQNFDLVIFDTVPLNFADSLLLIPQTDGLLMVTRLGKINRELLKDSLRTLETSKVPVLGLVVNMFNDKQSTASPYYLRQFAA